MKNKIIIVFSAILVCTTLCAAEDILPSKGICALGRISNIKEINRNLWNVDLSDIDILAENFVNKSDKPLEGSNFHKIKKMTILLQTGLGGVLVEPESRWVGRTALFLAAEDSGKYTVPNLQLDISPNGYSFVVFEPNDSKIIPYIKDMFDILLLSDDKTKSEKLAQVVKSPTYPVFIRIFAAKQFSQQGLSTSEKDMQRQIMVLWRNNEELMPILRLRIDELLVDISPRNYQMQTDRLNFLEEVKGLPSLTLIEARLVSSLLIEARRIRELEGSDP